MVFTQYHLTIPTLTHFIPALKERVYPVRSIDHRLYVGILHFLITTEPLANIVPLITASCHIVSSSLIPGELHFELISDQGTHHSFSRSQTGLSTILPLVVPVHWHFRLASAPALFNPAVVWQAHIGLLYASVADATTIASAEDIREALLMLDATFGQRVRAQYDQLEMVIQTGNASAWLAETTIPARVRFVNPFMVLHVKIMDKGPWVVGPKTFTQAQVEALIQPYCPRAVSLRPHALGIPAHASNRHMAPSGVPTPILRVSHQGFWFTSRIAIRLAERTRRHAARRARQRPFALKPIVASANLLVSTVVLLGASASTEEAQLTDFTRQVFTLLENPPPGVDNDWGNVAKLVVRLERTTQSEHTPDRSAVFEAFARQHPQALIYAVNPGAIATQPSEVALLGALPAVFVLGIPDDLARWVDADEDRLHVHDLDLGGVDVVRRFDHPLIPMAIRGLQALRNEDEFRSGLQKYIVDNLANYPTLRTELATFGQTHALSSFHFLIRVDPADTDDTKQRDISLNRHKAFLSNHLPPGATPIEVSHVSPYRGGSPVLLELDRFQDALVVITSVDQVARHPTAMTQIRQLCDQRRITLVAMLWPAAARQEFTNNGGAGSLMTQSLLNALNTADRAPVTERALPTMFPVIIAGPGREPAGDALVDDRAREAYHSVIGICAASFQGDLAIAMPSSYANASPGMSASNVALLRQQIHVVAPHLHVVIEVSA